MRYGVILACVLTAGWMAFAQTDQAGSSLAGPGDAAAPEEGEGEATQPDGIAEPDPGGELWFGRTAWQAPEVDGHVVVSGPSRPGSLVRVKITGGSAYDLEGQTVEELGDAGTRGDRGRARG